MKVVVISVGKVRQHFVKEGEEEYAKRLRGTPLALVLEELGCDAPESLSPTEVQEREAVALLKRLEPHDCVVVLDERGKELQSHEFSRLLEQRMLQGVRSLAFVIGGAFGFSEKVRQRADYVLSLSMLTMPHQLVRLVLVEQIYRAHTLMRGISYHK
jgi:23S rRNA (pseudouridine1915-N3)-methyltransferase